LNVASDTARPDAILGSRVRVPQGVVYRSFVKETVILNLETGLYHGLNPTGGRMLATLDQAPSVREAASRLAAEYERPLEEIESDLCGFCEALVERGLLAIETA
jgi:Coenzyme PQQ synthesis protein D (PqqD)